MQSNNRFIFHGTGEISMTNNIPNNARFVPKTVQIYPKELIDMFHETPCLSGGKTVLDLSVKFPLQCLESGQFHLFHGKGP